MRLKFYYASLFALKISVVILAFLFISPTFLLAGGKWVTDSKANFKVKIPWNYKPSRIMDGTDIVHAFLSPDENVAVRIRTIPINASVKIPTIIQAFEQNVIANAQKLVEQKHTLNKYSGKLCGYKWLVNNHPVVIAAFFTIQKNKAYVVWSLVPETMFKQRTPETDALINTFTILKNKKMSHKKTGGLFGSMGNVNHKKSNGNKKSTTPKHPKKKTKKFFDLVSDDAKVTHKVPVGFKIADKTEGQSIWKNSSGIKMVVQTIIKQGRFKKYMKGIVADIKKNGATIINNNTSVENGLVVVNYSYKYGNTFFAYGATEGSGVYYLVGFVGNVDNTSILEHYSEEANYSLKKVK